MGPLQQVCVRSFMDEISNRILESQLQKVLKGLFLETNERPIVFLSTDRGWDAEKTVPRAPSSLPGRELPGWIETQVITETEERMNYKEQDQQREQVGGGHHQ